MGNRRAIIFTLALSALFLAIALTVAVAVIDHRAAQLAHEQQQKETCNRTPSGRRRQCWYRGN